MDSPPPLPALRIPEGFGRLQIQPQNLWEGVCIDDFAGSPEDRRIERLAQDKRLLDALMWQEYSGPDWTAFSQALAEYGYQVIFAWSLSGRIFSECITKGFGVLKAPPRSIDRDDATELACETVAVSLRYFRDRVLVPSVWDATRGASLKTFFIGACVLGFANVYRQWRSENAPLTFLEDRPAPEPAIPSDAGASCDIGRLLERMAPRDRELLRLTALGYTQLEIAELLGTTRKSIERRLDRLRSQVGWLK